MSKVFLRSQAGATEEQLQKFLVPVVDGKIDYEVRSVDRAKDLLLNAVVHFATDVWEAEELEQMIAGRYLVINGARVDIIVEP